MMSSFVIAPGVENPIANAEGPNVEITVNILRAVREDAMSEGQGI
jgi:hypothetical protein